MIGFSDVNHRCLAIGRSHGLLGKSKEALALFAQASKLASASKSSEQFVNGPPKLDISREQSQDLQTILQGLVAQYRGLVTLEGISAEENSKSVNSRPVIERLHEYNADGLDLNNLVPYPPQMQPVPVKPLFLDVAWNYIDYPREGTAAEKPVPTEKPVEEKKEGRRGWFGFGGR